MNARAILTVRLMIPMEVMMSAKQQREYLSRIVGYIDILGYAWCLQCKAVPENAYFVVRADSCPHNEYHCERCGHPLNFEAANHLKHAAVHTANGN